MSDAIRDVLAEIFGEQTDTEVGSAIRVAHTTIMRIRSGRYIPSPETVDRITALATRKQGERLRRAVVLNAIRIPHPESSHPYPTRFAAMVAGEADPVNRVKPEDDAAYREALRLAVAAARVAAVAAPPEHRGKLAVLVRRLNSITTRLAGVSHG